MRPFPLSHASPYWSSLSSGEQEVALQTEGRQVVSTLRTYGRAMEGCLIDLRRARTVSQWRDLSARFERGKRQIFGELSDQDVRDEFLEACRVRFLLFGVQPPDASRHATDLVDTVIRLRSSGTWRPLALQTADGADASTADILRPDVDDYALESAVRLWERDGELIGTRSLEAWEWVSEPSGRRSLRKCPFERNEEFSAAPPRTTL